MVLFSIRCSDEACVVEVSITRTWCQNPPAAVRPKEERRLIIHAPGPGNRVYREVVAFQSSFDMCRFSPMSAHNRKAADML